MSQKHGPFLALRLSIMHLRPLKSAARLSVFAARQVTVLLKQLTSANLERASHFLVLLPEVLVLVKRGLHINSLLLKQLREAFAHAMGCLLVAWNGRTEKGLVSELEL